MGILEKLGLGKPNPEMKGYVEEFLGEGEPGQRIVDIYGSNKARFREILERYIDGSALEKSFFVEKNPSGDGLLIFPEGVFYSDGK
jgi:hypothetical protein